VEVVDQGVGIPKKFKPYIFKDFMQMDSSSTRTYEGAGLGLSISRAIIEKHHGILDFKSELNRGSTFFFQLPICNQVV
jgi:signal transduction histidine kinase